MPKHETYPFSLILFIALVVITCEVLMESTNTVITLSDSNVIDSTTADYACNGSKYILVGDTRRNCTSEGWTGEEPFCRGDCMLGMGTSI